MLNLLFQFLRLRYLVRLLRSPLSWSSLLFMLLSWLVNRRRSGR